MSNFQIHELNSLAVNRNSNIIHDTEVSTDEWDTGKDIAGAVADLASVNVAAPYDPTVTYAIGQYCLYEGNIYRCIAITTGVFDSTKWTQIVVTGEFRRVVELTSAQYAQLTPAEQNNGTLYIITDEETTAADIPYSAGVSVADKLYIEGSSTVGDTVWSYRKWNSGILEIWGKYSHAVSDSYHTWGSWYAYDVPSMGAYPISFIALHSTVVNFGSNVNIGMIGVKANANPLTNAPEGLLVRPTQGGVETRIYGDLYAKGTWK